METKRFAPCCELCGGEAALYCGPDAAFLCWACDADVHGANFLVARHVRSVACAACRSLDDVRPFSGAGCRRPVRYLCRQCESDPESFPSSSPAASASSSSSSCLSTSESAAALRREKPAAKRWRRLTEVDQKAEGVLSGWSRRMGLSTRRQCVAAAVRMLGASERVLRSLPMRVALAGALWFAVKLCDESAGRGGGEAALRRLETCSGVPSRLIDFTESRIARSAGRVRLAEEGWAECS